jgi:hypothetical protein
MLGHAAPAAVPAPGAALGPAGLASLSRELAWARRPGGRPAAVAGGPMRNVELVIRDPRRAAAR